MEYGVTDKGFVMKRFDTILKEVQEDVSGSLGFDVTQNPQSLLNSALIIPFCDKLAALWEVSQESYYAKYPSTAEGVNLDNACQYSNVFRQGNKHSDYMIHCTASDGTVIPEGSLISSATNPVVQLKCAQDTEITRESCNTISIKPVIVADGTYTIGLNGKLYSFTATKSSTLTSIIEGLAAAFNVPGYSVATDTQNGILTISDNVVSRSNSFSLSSNLTTNYVISCVHYYTVEYGDIECPEGSICEVTSNVTGLMAVTNMIEHTAGRIQQNDILFRQDYIRKSYGTSSTMTESVEAYILDNVDGVKDVRCYENPYNVEDELGRPPHSIEVIVDGGKEEHIAPAILAKKSGGIETCGDITINVLGEFGDQIPIKFRRPEPVYAWIKVELTTDGSNIDPDYVSVVQEAICNKADGISIGDSMMTQTFISGIYERLAGIAYCKITVASSLNLDKKPSKFADGNISTTQRQAVRVDASRIEVSLKT